MLRIHCKNTSGGSLHLRNGIHSLLNSCVLPGNFYSGNMEDAVKYRYTLFVSLLSLLFWSLVASNPFKAFKKTIKSKLSFCLNFSFLSKLLASQERIPLVAVKTNKPVAWVCTYTYSWNAWIFLLQWMLCILKCLLCIKYCGSFFSSFYRAGRHWRGWLCTIWCITAGWLFCIIF